MFSTAKPHTHAHDRTTCVTVSVLPCSSSCLSWTCTLPWLFDHACGCWSLGYSVGRDDIGGSLPVAVVSHETTDRPVLLCVVRRRPHSIGHSMTTKRRREDKKLLCPYRARRTSLYWTRTMSCTLLITELADSCFQSATVFRMLFIDSLLLLVHRLGTHIVCSRVVYNRCRQQGNCSQRWRTLTEWWHWLTQKSTLKNSEKEQIHFGCHVYLNNFSRICYRCTNFSVAVGSKRKCCSNNQHGNAQHADIWPAFR